MTGKTMGENTRFVAIYINGHEQEIYGSPSIIRHDVISWLKISLKDKTSGQINVIAIPLVAISNLKTG